MLIDLHCHSTCSDGSLSPSELIKLAQTNNVQMLSITDHDNMDAYTLLPTIDAGIQLIKGIEFSTTWKKIGIHVLGLNLNDRCIALKTAISHQKQARIDRAQTIARRLRKCGLSNAYESIVSEKNAWQIGRPDFAKLLVDAGLFRDVPHAFKKVLGRGKLGDVKSQWLDLQEIIAVIRNAGGMAVLAHPLSYQLTNTKLRSLLKDFTSLGGQGIEIKSGPQNTDKTSYLLSLCQTFNLSASVGSDFHHQTQWNHLGCYTDWLSDVDCVWQHF